MDAISLSFLIFVVLLGGFIALAADRLGRKLGKKRLSMFGLRPRHTAEVMTVGAGILIPFVTVAIIMAASSDVREWLIQGRQLALQSQVLKGQVETLTERGQLLDREIGEKTVQTEKLDAELKVVQNKVTVLEGRAKKYLLESQRASKRASALQARLSTINSELAAKLLDLEKAQTQVQEAKKSYAALMRDYSTVEREREESYKENLRLDHENELLNKQIAEVSQMVTQLGSDRDRLQTDLSKVQKAYQDTLATFEADLERIKLQRDQRQGELRAAEEMLAVRTEQLRQNLGKTRTEPLIFNSGEELARLPIEPGLTPELAESALVSLLRASRTRAAEKGAQPLTGSTLVAGLVERPMGNTTVSVAEQESQIIKSITGHKENLVLIASAGYNVFRGEFVPVLVRVFRNPVIFKEGATIAETRIDGSQTEDEVARDVAEFVRTQVVARAMQEQMLPVKGREDGFGQVDILEAIKQIREAGRAVRVRAIVESETRAAGPLKIRLAIR